MVVVNWYVFYFKWFGVVCVGGQFWCSFVGGGVGWYWFIGFLFGIFLCGLYGFWWVVWFGVIYFLGWW